MVRSYLQKKVFQHLTGETRLSLNNSIPSEEVLRAKFEQINELGIYLHIPFCRQICPYCPYNKVLYNHDLAGKYKSAVMREADYYASIAGDRPVTSFYIGGGTPTSMINNGLGDIISHIYRRFSMQCSVHVESHPNDLTCENLAILKSLGVKYLSIGVEALQERHLRTLQRPYTVREVKKSIERAVNTGFDCVNVDLIFALPDQDCREIDEAGNDLVKLGIHQAATYPLFYFPYTRMGKDINRNRPTFQLLLRRRKMLGILEDIFYNEGFRRSSVWAFTKKGTDKYCSVTVPLYLGLGVSGGSYLRDVFFVNTFNVKEYIRSIEEKKYATALSVNLTEEMQMAGWLYWRIYETSFRKKDFMKRFHKDFDGEYGRLMRFLSYAGYLKDQEDTITLTDRGAYWLHAFEDWFSIDFISRLWGNSGDNPWPERVILVGDGQGG